jgi:hypothetical protein
MCIYTDEHIYEGSFDENKVYQYLYHLIYMLSKQRQLFKKHSYYEDFAIYAANRVYLRLTNKKQWEVNEDGTPKQEKIKSVLNYIKNVLYPFKVDFEQSEYCQTISKDSFIEEVDYNFDNLIKNSVDELTFCEFGLTFNDIGKTCKAFLNTIPYKPKSSEWLNIYVSVMLTFLNTVTLTNRRKRRLDHLSDTSRLKEDHLIDAYKEENDRSAILFHLPESMSAYITVLARQLKHLVAKDLTSILHTNVSNDMELLPLSIKDYIEDYGEDNEY